MKIIGHKRILKKEETIEYLRNRYIRREYNDGVIHWESPTKKELEYNISLEEEYQKINKIKC